MVHKHGLSCLRPSNRTGIHIQDFLLSSFHPGYSQIVGAEDEHKGIRIISRGLKLSI